MMGNSKQKIIGIIGPTASGKSAVGIDLVKTEKCVVINADSCQIYSGLEVLSAQKDVAVINDFSLKIKETQKFEESNQTKMTCAEKFQKEEHDQTKMTDAENSHNLENNFRHHLYGIYNAQEQTNVAIWAQEALKEVQKAFASGLQPVILGGTGMYFKYLQSGFVKLPEISQKTQEKLKNFSLEEIVAKLPEEITQKFKDRRRLERALGIYLETQNHITDFFKQDQEKLHDYELEIYALNPSKEELWDRIEKRLDRIFLEAIKEVRSMLHLQKHITIGFNEIKEFLSKNGIKKSEDILDMEKFNLQELEALKQEIFFKTRQYAKRQKTFMKTLKIEKEFCDRDQLFEYLKNNYL